jgi:hypothetical protein
MKRNRVLHLALDVVARTAGRNATRKVWRVRGVAGRGLLDDDEVFHVFNRLSAHAAASPSLSHEVPLGTNRETMTPLVERRHDLSPF